MGRYLAEGVHLKGLVGLGDKVVLQVGRPLAVQSAESSMALAAEVGGRPPEQLWPGSGTWRARP